MLSLHETIRPSADEAMIEMGIRREDRKKYVDEIAAMFILRGYLEYLETQKKKEN